MPSGMQVLIGEDLDGVVDRFTAVWFGPGAPRLPPLDDEVVIVPSAGLRDWLRLQLARRLGIAAGLDLPFPADWARRLLDPAGVGAGFDRETLTWQLHALLPRLDAAGPLPGYLAVDADPRRPYRLARRVAALFDDYLLYRPELLAGWEAGRLDGKLGEHEAWQAAAWQELCRGAGRRPAQDLLRLIEGLERGPAPAGLPPRVAAVGITTLPPVFARLLAALARHRPVLLAAVSPVADRWSHLARRSAEDEDAEPANPLLAAWGMLGRDFIARLEPHEETGAGWDIAPPAPRAPGLLGAVQQAVHLVEEPGGADPVIALDEVDDSLRLHACHAPLREVEALHDWLLAAFDAAHAAGRPLAPDQVLVLCTDPVRYAPLVAAVFAREVAGRRLPVELADQGAAGEPELLRLLPQLLELVGGRWGAEELLALFDCAALRRRADIADADLPVLQRWVSKAGVRFGWDGEQRAADLALPATAEQGWLHGLRRLLLGHVCGADGCWRPGGPLPTPDATAARGGLLGRFVQALEDIAALLADWKHPRPLAAWVAALQRAVDQLVTAEDRSEEQALVAVTAVLVQLGAAAPEGGDPVPAVLVAEHLTQLLEAAEPVGRSFRSGRIAVAGLKPLRTIPARVIAVLGLDEARFPRREQRPPFDLLAARPLPGDRSVRRDDRFLFLETVLACRERLLLSWVGHDAASGASLPPSACVQELLEHLGQAVTVGGTALDPQRLVVHHPLHAWSPRYGREPGLASYVRSAHASTAPPAFAAAPLTGAVPTALDLSDLLRCWTRPAEWFCSVRLGLDPDVRGVLVASEETFVPEGLERWSLRQSLMTGLLAGLPEAELAQRAQQDGLVATGAWGRQQVRQALVDLRDLAGRIRAAGPARAPELLRLELERVQLSGSLRHRHAAGFLHWRPGPVRACDRLQAWLVHVAAAVGDRGAPSSLVGLDRSGMDDTTLPELAPDLARPVLAAAIAGWRAAWSHPLPLDPDTGLAIAESLHGGGDPAAALAAARKVLANRQRVGAAERLLERDRDPLADADAAVDLARRVWLPLLEAGA